MKLKKRFSFRLFKPSDLFLPGAFLMASLLGRGNAALHVFVALFVIRLCSLSGPTALRSAFARQPSMRYVQGSALLALSLLIPGTALAALLSNLLSGRGISSTYPILLCGLFLNIEHVFYEYLFAAGDDASAAMCRAITSVLTLLGLLLCGWTDGDPGALVLSGIPWPTLTCGLSALVGLIISLTLGGALRPKINGEVIRRAPFSMLQTALYPALALTALRLALPSMSPAIPLFAGWLILEPWRTPFRRTPSEAGFMNRALLAVGAVTAFCGMICGLMLPSSDAPIIASICGAILLAALCAFAMYGSVSLRRRDEA